MVSIKPGKRLLFQAASNCLRQKGGKFRQKHGKYSHVMALLYLQIASVICLCTVRTGFFITNSRRLVNTHGCKIRTPLILPAAYQINRWDITRLICVIMQALMRESLEHAEA